MKEVNIAEKFSGNNSEGGPVYKMIASCRNMARGRLQSFYTPASTAETKLLAKSAIKSARKPLKSYFEKKPRFDVKKWQELLRTFNRHTASSKFCKMVRSLDGNKSVAGSHPSSFNGKNSQGLNK